jgi:hypothetical protein
MALRYDIALENNDIAFVNGDMYVAESDEQHIIDIINAFPGWWKEYPFMGVGLMRYMKSNTSAQEVNKNVKTQLQADGYTLNSNYVTLNASGLLTINPNVNVDF